MIRLWLNVGATSWGLFFLIFFYYSCGSWWKDSSSCLFSLRSLYSFFIETHFSLPFLPFSNDLIFLKVVFICDCGYISSSGGYTLTFQFFLLSFFFLVLPFFEPWFYMYASWPLFGYFLYIPQSSTVASLRYYRSPESKEEKRKSVVVVFFLLLYFLSFLCVFWFLYSSFFFIFFFDVFCVVIRRNDLLYATPSTTTTTTIFDWFFGFFRLSCDWRWTLLPRCSTCIPSSANQSPISLHSCTIRFAPERTACLFLLLLCLLQYFLFSFSLFFVHQQFVMGCERCSRLIQFLPEEENKIIFAFAGCESEYLTV